MRSVFVVQRRSFLNSQLLAYPGLDGAHDAITTERLILEQFTHRSMHPVEQIE